MATKTSVANGLWSAPGTWDLGVPVDTDLVIIAHTVTFDVNQSAFVTGVAVTIWKGGTLQVSTTPGVYQLKASADIQGSTSGTGAMAQLLAGTQAVPIPYAAKTFFNLNSTFHVNVTNLWVSVWSAVPAVPVLHTTVLAGVGATVLTVDADVTTDLWAVGDTVLIWNYPYSGATETRVISAISATQITLTAGLTTAKAVGARILLQTSNVRFSSGNTVNGYVFIGTNTNTALRHDIQAEVSGNAYGLSACTNANVYNNAACGNTQGLASCTNANVYNNAACGNTQGLVGCTNANVYNNAASGNTYGLNACTNANVYNNAACGNTYGLTSCTNANVYNNAACGNTYGLNGCTNANVYNNAASGNSQGLASCTNANVYNNAACSNTYGLNGCTNATLHGTQSGNTVADVYLGYGGNVYGYGASLSSTTQVVNYALGANGTRQQGAWLFDIGGVAGALKAWMGGGRIVSDTVTLPPGTTITTTWQYIFESAVNSPVWVDLPLLLKAGTNTVKVYVKKDTNGMTATPKAQLLAATDINGATPLSEVVMVDDTNWQTLTLTYTSATAQQAIVRVEGKNATGSLWTAIAVQGGGGISRSRIIGGI